MVMSQRRVVVTGMGAITPFGLSVDTLWENLIEGRSGVSLISIFDTSAHSIKFGGQIPNFNPKDHLAPKLVKRLDRYAQLAMIACAEAADQAGLSPESVDPARLSVVFGSGIGGLNELEEQNERLLHKGPSKVSAFTIPKLMVNAAAGNIAIAHNAKGLSIAVSSACASANNAMGEALRHIRLGLADVIITGGAEAALTPLALAAFSSMKALSSRNDDPEAASRPFDRDRDGFVLGEGSGALIFEELEHAKKRGADIFAEIIGFASTCDADHITQPAADGEGAAEAMRQAVKHAGISPDAVDYVNVHGTSTPLGDLAETVAIHKVFGDAASKLVASSTKSAIGHSLGASGGIEMITCIRAIQQSVVPPTINLENPSDGCDLDYCPNSARDRKIDVALNNSFGFGGHNACLIARRYS